MNSLPVFGGLFAAFTLSAKGFAYFVDKLNSPDMIKITEQRGPYGNLEQRPVAELTALINEEDKKVALAIETSLPALNRLIEKIVDTLENGGRLFYVGAGSGGRLSVLDMIELPTTFGIERGLVEVVLAGGLDKLVDALEDKEDDPIAGWQKLLEKNVSAKDIAVGISASGTTPFVLGAMQHCRKEGITTGCIVSNLESPIAAESDYPVEVITGPEFISGSTRMKCGTAQKMIFDMISTTVMIRRGKVLDNQMVNVKLINDKITDRAVKMLMEKAGISNYDEARTLLLDRGSVSQALQSISRS